MVEAAVFNGQVQFLHLRLILELVGILFLE